VGSAAIRRSIFRLLKSARAPKETSLCSVDAAEMLVATYSTDSDLTDEARVEPRIGQTRFHSDDRNISSPVVIPVRKPSAPNKTHFTMGTSAATCSATNPMSGLYSSACVTMYWPVL
jgi:hypothetical protein